MNTPISAQFPYPSHYIEIFGSKMHYVEKGQGDPILFLHGIPTSCYLWRNIIPHLSSLGRCIAPDLIGFGKSDKPNIGYTIKDHIRYIDTFIEKMNLNNLTLILHGWGSIIGFDYAMRHEKNIKGIVFYESYLREANKEDVSLPFEEQIFILNEKESNGEILFNASEFIDKVLPQGMARDLTDLEMKHYREPFLKEGSEKPLIQYLHELPKAHNEVNEIIAQYSKKLKKSSIPKLMLYSIPGFITSISTVLWAQKNIPHLEVTEIGEALHYAQESSPFMMGESISIWLQGIEQEEKLK